MSVLKKKRHEFRGSLFQLFNVSNIVAQCIEILLFFFQYKRIIWAHYMSYRGADNSMHVRGSQPNGPPNCASAYNF